MLNLLKKEFRLSMHPTVPFFFLLSAMVMIPNYPYYVTFFYTTLSFFFTCLQGRENGDAFYTMTLPVAKRDVVKSRYFFCVIIEIIQIILTVPFMLLRQSMPIPGNQVGMDANVALLGFGLIMLGIFNVVFFAIYYRDVKKVGKAFLIASVVEFVYIAIMEALDHIVPFFCKTLDTSDNMNLAPKSIVLLIGAVIFTLLTLISLKQSLKNFEKQNI